MYSWEINCKPRISSIYIYIYKTVCGLSEPQIRGGSQEEKRTTLKKLFRVLRFVNNIILALKYICNPFSFSHEMPFMALFNLNRTK